jgi:hypothetical protein
MWEALREAVDEEMERDPTVCVMGAPSEGGVGWGAGVPAARPPARARAPRLSLGAPDCGSCRSWRLRAPRAPLPSPPA